jgi:hypothetical protein
MGYVPMENGNRLVVDSTLTHATGTAERETTLTMLDRRPSSRRITLGVDKAYDLADSVGKLRARKVTLHIAVNCRVYKTGKRRKSAIDNRTTRHPGYDISQRCRKRIEEIFGWAKASAGLTKFKLRGSIKPPPSSTSSPPPTTSLDCQNGLPNSLPEPEG